MKARDVLCNVGGWLVAMVLALSALALVMGVGIGILVGMHYIGILTYFCGLVLIISAVFIGMCIWLSWGRDLAQKCKNYWND